MRSTGNLWTPVGRILTLGSHGADSAGPRNLCLPRGRRGDRPRTSAGPGDGRAPAFRNQDAYTYEAAAFGFVRDGITHSADSGDTRITWRASDVLSTRNGICHAKSHALIALRLPGRDRWDRRDPRGNRASTRGSHWMRNTWPGPSGRSSTKWTTQASVRHRTRWFCVACGPRPTVPSSGARFRRRSDSRAARRVVEHLAGVTFQPWPRCGRSQPRSRTSAGVGAVPPRWAGTHQVSLASLGRTG